MVCIFGAGESDRFVISGRVLEKEVVYRVWYILNGELRMVSCGRDADQAWRTVVYYATPPSYSPWMEFINEKEKN